MKDNPTHNFNEKWTIKDLEKEVTLRFSKKIKKLLCILTKYGILYSSFWEKVVYIILTI